MYRRTTALLALGVTLATLGFSATAHADDEGPAEIINEYTLYSPYVVQGQSEVELRAAEFRDDSLVLNDTRGYVVSIAHSFTDWWQPEIYLGKYQTLPRNPNRFVGNEFENLFQLTETGKYWADVGFLASYEFASNRGEPNALEFGPLLARQDGQWFQRLNLIWEKQIGAGAGRNYEFRANYGLDWQWRPTLAPGVQLYLRPSQNVYQAGPALSGEWHVGMSELEYSLAVVLSVNQNAPDRTLILNLEYEFL
jgi:hypothetical protein